jgi:hypothetical protein
MTRAGLLSALCLATLIAAPVAVSAVNLERREMLRAQAGLIDQTIAQLEGRLSAASENAMFGAGGGVAPVFFLEGATEAVAAADLQARIARAAAEANVAVQEFEVVRAAEDEAAVSDRVRLRVVVNGGNEALQAILFVLEQGRPAIRVRSLNLGAVSGSGAEPELTAALVVEAYRSVGR